MAATNIKSVLADEPSPFDTLETWERHLESVKAMPAGTILREAMMKAAQEMITKKRT